MEVHLIDERYEITPRSKVCGLNHSDRKNQHACDLRDEVFCRRLIEIELPNFRLIRWCGPARY
jgi:hypothetical protein